MGPRSPPATAAESAGSRAHQSRPIAISSGPARRNRRGPSRPAIVPTRVDSSVSMIPAGTPIGAGREGGVAEDALQEQTPGR